MTSRLVTLILLGLLLVLQAQLWVGRGSVPNVARMTADLDQQKQKNAQAKLDNDRLAAEVQDVQNGLDYVEEKARLELGMVKPNEIYVHYTRP
ncbi:MAG: septum formation initiator family protein [Hylemonella sp.]|jgi:cell division protein FtsB